MIIKAIGLDNSNSSIKAVSAKKTLNYLNTLTEVRDTNTSNVVGNKKDVFTYRGKSYTVGAVNGVGSGGKDETRYYSEQFKTETAIALSQLVKVDVEDLKYNVEILRLIVGLPANLAERTDIIELMKNKLVDNYEVVHNNQVKRFRVDSVGVVAQPVGTFYSAIYNKNEKDVFKRPFLIIDIGFGTTDLIELDNGQLGNNRTLSTAMSDYVANLYTAIENRYPDSRLSQAVESPYALDRMLIDTDILELPRGNYNVSDIKHSLQNEFATSVKSALNRYGYNFERYYRILITGGGSKIMENAIRCVFNNDSRIELVDDPVLCNANGFYLMSKQVYKL